jgi:bifunctional enzyme CysN/CysC
MELLRFVTAGSVDDGKSTLIGRLLYDSKGIFEDQLEAVERSSLEAGLDYVNLALLTDGLRAEREQGITIDVAYRYFATPIRKFIIADCPGHVQYTRNMVTGASTADLALILVDARAGVIEQTRRHSFLTSLLGINELVLCVNKMDLVDFKQTRFDEVQKEFADFTQGLGELHITAIPLSALEGDNVVASSTRMPWYDGPSLLHFLETVEANPDHDRELRRFPIQSVIRPMSSEYPDYRGYAGSVASGIFSTGDEVIVLPSEQRTRIASIDTLGGKLPEAAAPLAVTLRLEDDLDISRGHMIVDPNDPPSLTSEFEATVCWMSAQSALAVGQMHWLKHTTRRIRARISSIEYLIDVNTLEHKLSPNTLTLNEIGNVCFHTTEPIFLDPYTKNRATGSFILIDQSTNNTVGAGLITGPCKEQPA